MHAKLTTLVAAAAVAASPLLPDGPDATDLLLPELSPCSAVSAGRSDVLSGPRTPRRDGEPGLGADRGREETPRSTTVSERDLGRAADAFAFDLMRSLGGSGNLACSPASVYLALMLAWAGAEGETARELAEVLHIASAHDGEPWRREEFLAAARALLLQSDGADGGPAIAVASALFRQQGHPFEGDYSQAVETRLQAALRDVDFAGDAPGAREAINAWIQEATGGRIEEMLSPGTLKETTRLLLANTVTFDARWMDAFLEEATHSAPFRTHAGGSVSVPTMHRTNYERILETDRFQLLELRYKIGEGKAFEEGWSMMFLLPREGVALADLEGELTPELLERWSDALEVARVDISLPRFHLRTRTNLSRTLAGMGLSSSLDPQAADFSGIDGGVGQLFIDLVLQQVEVSVHENGTEAAAATAVVFRLGSRATPSKPKVFRADRPFLFLVRRHQDGRILFTGRVADPRGGEDAAMPTW